MCRESWSQCEFVIVNCILLVMSLFDPSKVHTASDQLSGLMDIKSDEGSVSCTKALGLSVEKYSLSLPG